MEVARRTWRLCSLWIALLTFLSPWSVLQVIPAPVTPVAPVSRTKPGKWQVSNMGRCRDTRGNITPGYLHPDGYVRVTIQGCHFLLHRLVAHAFLGLPPTEKKWIVNHIDHSRSNNWSDNLEYVTHKQNMRHSYAKNSLRRRKVTPVMVRPVESQEWITFPSVKAAAKHLGQPYSTAHQRFKGNANIDGFEYRFVRLDEHILPDLPGEVWRPMIDPKSGLRVDGKKISSAGRIKSHTGRISTGFCGQSGYVYVNIKVKGHRRNELLHRLVAVAFLGPPPTPHTQINHKDGNKSNNIAANLEYATASENLLHHHANRKGLHPLCKAVLSREYGSSDPWTNHSSFKSAADALGVRRELISCCINGKRRQTGGFEFRLEEPDGTTMETLPGEEWRDVDVPSHLKDRRSRKNR